MKRFLLSVFLLEIFVSTLCGQSSVFIVRHAEKAKTEGDNPELSEPGYIRAEDLAKMLKNAGITTIYATEFKRTQETAAPLAKILGIDVTIVPAKTSLAARLMESRGSRGNTLVVGHGNTIPNLIAALGITDPIDIAENDYDNLFVVLLEEKPRLIRLHYR